MPVNTPFRASPDLGPQIKEVQTVVPHYDSQLGVSSGSTTFVSPPLGSKAEGSDGGEYYYVEASANIAATPSTGTQVTIAFPAYTVATGTGGFWTPPGVAILAGRRFFVRRGAWNAVPA
jgi:hypothetical protein